ncbi:MAG: transglutaminase family protein [Oscillospiraceae bacterium]
MKEYAKKAAFPIILSALLVSMIMNIYNGAQIVPITVAAFVVEGILFFLFKLLSKRKVLGGLIYTVILIGVLFFLGQTLMSNWYDAPIPFSSWFYAAQDESTAFLPFSILLFVGFSFFLASVLFYYTQIIYRSAAVLLCSLIPFAIYAKRYETPDIIYIAAVLVVFLALMVHQRQLSDKDFKVFTDGSYWISVTIFVAAVIAFAVAVPKFEVTPLRDKFDEMIEAMEGVSVNSDRAMGKMSTISSGSDFSAEPTGQMYYYVLSDDAPLYLKSQSYDEYEGDRKWSVSKEYYEMGYSYWENEMSYLDYATFVSALKEYAEDNGISEQYFIPDIKSSVKTAEIYASDFPSQYALTANGILGITEIDNEMRVTFRNPHGDIFWESSYMPPTDKYRITYYSENNDIRNGAAKFAMQFDRNSFKDTCTQIFDNPDTDYVFKAAVKLFSEECEEAEKYLHDTKGEIPQRIKELAEEITADCSSDYEKAAAIEEYFLTNGYRYQLGYKALSPDIETFIFKDKTGICADYATAYVLMARAVDLPARYTVGFLMTEPMSEGYYAVRDRDAHAWAEVYIAGYGWMTFDATPASVVSGNELAQNAENNNDPVKTMVIFLIVVAAAVIVAILLILFMPMIKEGVFRISLGFSGKEKAVVKLYRHTAWLIAKKFNINTKAFSTVELCEYSKNELFYDISPITKLVEKVCYGKIAPQKEEIEKSIDCYKTLYTVIKKTK